MDWESLYCPNQHWGYYGVPFPQSRIVRNGTYREKQGLFFWGLRRVIYGGQKVKFSATCVPEDPKRRICTF